MTPADAQAPLHVLLLLRSLERNGITTYNRVLAAALRRAGHRVTVWPGDPVWAGVTWPGWWLRPGAAPLLAPRVRALAPDLIYVSHYTQGLLAAALSARTGIAWFACMHNGHSAPRMAQWQRLLASARGVVTLCQSMHDVYADLIGSGQRLPRLHVGALPLDMPPARPVAPRAPDGRVRLAYCARLSGQKGPRCEAWLRAVALLAPQLPVHARVIGGGSHLPALRRLARELRLEVEFTGLVADPAPWLADVDVLSGAGYALIEGLVRGCAGVGIGFGGCWGAITTDRLAASVAVNFGDHCPHPLPDSPESIRDALLRALEAVRTGEAQHVADQCRSLFDADAQTRELVAFWRQQLSDR